MLPLDDMRQNEAISNLLKFVKKKYNSDEKPTKLCIERWIQRKGFGLLKKDVHKADENVDDEKPLDTNKEKGTKWTSMTFGIENIILFREIFSKSKYISKFNIELRYIIWNETKAPCTFKFNLPEFANGEFSVACYCPERRCSCMVKFETLERREKLKMAWTNYNEKVNHGSKKAYLTGDIKSEILDMLKRDSPQVVYTELVNKLMDSNDRECPLLPNMPNLKQMAYRDRKTNAMVRNEHPILSICQMRLEMEFYDCIHSIGIYPFFTFYSTPLQQSFARSEIKRSRWIALSLDSTGISTVLPAECAISERTGKMRKVFLYNILLHGSKTLPVFQMVSQDQSSRKVSEMLKFWKDQQTFGKNVNEVIMDKSPTLLLSVTETLTSFSCVNEYLNHMFDCLLSSGESNEPFLRIDRSHAVKLIQDNKAIAKIEKTPREFYRRIMGYLIQVDDFNIFQKVIEDVFDLLHREFINVDDKPLREMRSALFKLANTHEDDYDEEYKVMFEDIDELELERNKFHNWIGNISKAKKALHPKVKSKRSIGEGFEKNPLHVPSIEKALIDLFALMPLAGNIMCKSFRCKNYVPSSTPTEVSFRVIKKDLFKNQHNLRIDNWLEKHIRFLKGKIIGKDIGSGEENECEENNNHNENIECDVDVDVECNEEENCLEDDNEENREDEVFDDEFDAKIKQEIWRDGNDLAKPEKKKFELRRNRCKSSILNAAKKFYSTIPILKNGFRDETHRKMIVTQHTCAFDTFFQTYLALYVDNVGFKALVDRSDGDFVNLIKLTMVAKEKKEVYCERNKLLLKYYNEDTDMKDRSLYILADEEKLLHIDCFIGINQMFKLITGRQRELFSIKQTKACEVCGVIFEEKQMEYIPIDANKANLKNITPSIFGSELKSKLKCKNCDCYLKIIRKPSKIIVVDCENFRSSMTITTIDKETVITHLMFSLEDVAKTIMYSHTQYTLFAVIEGTENHFITNILRGDEWEAYDDLHPQGVLKPKKKLVPMQLFYIVDESNRLPAMKNTSTPRKLMVKLGTNTYNILKENT